MNTSRHDLRKGVDANGSSHQFVEQNRLAAKAEANQAATFWKGPRPATKKKPLPAIGTVEGPKGSFS